MQNSRGYTLIEVLVAGVLAALAVIGVVAVIVHGRGLETSDYHRRQARVLLDSLMETKFDDRQYDAIPVAVTQGAVTLEPGFPAATLFQDVQQASMTVGTTTIPYKIALLKVRWQEADGTLDSITLDKWIAKVRQPLWN